MIRQRLEPALRRLWFGPPNRIIRTLGLLLAPLSLLTARVASGQRARIAALSAPTVPVVVIGNLVTGGAGKTPLVACAVQALASRGWRPGILASGYGARRTDARLVGADDDPIESGDEPVLLAQLTGRPVAAGRRRADALAALLTAHPEIDVVVSDDGLQHAALPRTLEIAVFDRRGAGNGRLLPAGPLREPLAHLAGMDAIAVNGSEPPAQVTAAAGPLPVFRFDIAPHRFVRVDGRADPLSLQAFATLVRAQPGLAAIAGIGEPQRFFDALERLGLPVAQHIAPGDHRTLDASALRGLAARLIVMTTKDAVKCRQWADDRCWALEVRAEPSAAFIDWLDNELREAKLGRTSARHPRMPGLQGAAAP